MSNFFGFLSTFLTCATVFGIASLVALSLPKSRFRTVLNELLCWAFAALCMLYVGSPVDLVPEAGLGPVGFIDDVGAIYLGWQKIKDALKMRKQRRAEDDLA